jgi:hypothetical protein
MSYHLIFPVLWFLVSFNFCFSQEAILSQEEAYYDFLALDNAFSRPYLNYRTLSDSIWIIPDQEAQIWDSGKLGSSSELTKYLKFRLYGPEIFSSFNTNAPYGQNDGALWQGRGLNSSVTGGFRLETRGLAVTFKPQMVFSQNSAFTLMSSAYDSEYGYIWGYAHNIGVDSPQRFGSSEIFDVSWGDSEIRYSWKTLTIGFGTQSVWLGPGHINSLLHSNNAAPYPKADIGLRKTPLFIRGWNAGFLEARLWTGYLTESGFFDNDPENNHNMINGLALSYAPSFLPGLTLSGNRIFTVSWDTKNFSYIPELFFVSLNNDTQVQEKEDQKASLSFSYMLTKVGFEVYGELGIDDYVAGSNGYIRYPFHTMVFSGGLRKSVMINESKQVKAEITAEWTNLELSQDFQLQWPSTFYGHHNITQGYTNEGQWIGAGIGSGGNSQYLGCKLYYPKGFTNFSLYRVNPDNNYIYVQAINSTPDENPPDISFSFKANFTLGVESMYFITDSLSLSGGFFYNYIINPRYEFGTEINNFQFTFGFKMLHK